jgi:curli biogenesis system outer membrane secretion channel CsgG
MKAIRCCTSELVIGCLFTTAATSVPAPAACADENAGSTKTEAARAASASATLRVAVTANIEVVSFPFRILLPEY